MKLAVAGKGGVGKTFVTATLSRLLARDGYNVLAVDADPNINLGYSLGFPREIADNITPLSDNYQLIEDKTGVKPDNTYGAVFNLTPKVDDIVDKYGVTGPDGVNLLVMGTVKGGGTGCMCGANTLLRVLIQHLLIQRGEFVIMDMVAGLEHIGRGTAKRMDLMLVVLEPRMKSIDTARRVLKLAEDINVKEVYGVGNKINSKKEEEFLEEKMSELGIKLLANIPYDKTIAEADMYGKSAMDYCPDADAVKAIEGLKNTLQSMYDF